MTDFKEMMRKARLESQRESEAYEAALPGWRESRAQPCPRSVAGKRCRRWGYGRWGGPDCVCEVDENRLLDHVRMWLTPKVVGKASEVVLTASPYHVDPRAFDQLQEACAELGLTLWQEAQPSPYRHGSHFLVIAKDQRSVDAQMWPEIASTKENGS